MTDLAAYQPTSGFACRQPQRQELDGDTAIRWWAPNPAAISVYLSF